VVAVEYFTKWIEVRPVATITSRTIRKFSGSQGASHKIKRRTQKREADVVFLFLLCRDLLLLQ
jgi:hypothetical protein